MVTRLGLWKDDIIDFELDIDCFAFTLIRANTSSQTIMKCKHHYFTVAKMNNTDKSWLPGNVDKLMLAGIL
jgi:hypothetical protein